MDMVTEKQPSLWLDDLSTEELKTLLEIGKARIGRIGSYYCEKYGPSHDANRRQQIVRQRELRILQDRYTETYNAAADEASKIIHEREPLGGVYAGLKGSSELAYLQGKLDVIRDLMGNGTKRKRDFDSISPVDSSKHHKRSESLDKSSEDEPRCHGLDESMETCFVMFTRISGYCEHLSQEARDNLLMLRGFASDGSLETWINETKTNARLFTVNSLCRLAVLIDRSLTRLCGFARLDGLGNLIFSHQSSRVSGRPESSIEPICGDIVDYVDSWYPLMLKLEQMYPGNYIEDLQYIWYLIAEFNDYRREADSPKKEDFEGIPFFGGVLAEDMLTRVVMQHPPPLENLAFSFTTIAEALLSNKELTSQMMDFIAL
jgi:hypothetical protein